MRGKKEVGICVCCRDYPTVDRAKEEAIRRAREEDLERALVACRGQGEYDWLMNLSEGKDSCYLTYELAKEYGLKVLAFTTDINVPDVAWENIRRTVDALGVDHLTYEPPREFYRKFYRETCASWRPATLPLPQPSSTASES